MQNASSIPIPVQPQKENPWLKRVAVFLLLYIIVFVWFIYSQRIRRTEAVVKDVSAESSKSIGEASHGELHVNFDLDQQHRDLTYSIPDPGDWYVIKKGQRVEVDYRLTPLKSGIDIVGIKALK